MKKGQIQGQIFIYVLTLIIAGIIFMFGYNSIMSFTSQIETSKLINFEVDTKKVFSKISTEYQSLETHTFTLPTDYQEVCFVDFTKLSKTPTEDLDTSNPADLLDRTMIVNSIESGINDNVFIYTDWLERSFDVGNVRIRNCDGSNLAFKCYSLFNGQLTLKIRGLGNVAEIQEVRIDETCV